MPLSPIDGVFRQIGLVKSATRDRGEDEGRGTDPRCLRASPGWRRAGSSTIYAAMAIFPRPSGPSAVWADLKAFLKQQERPKFFILLLSIAIPLLIVAGFYHDAGMDKPAPQIVYVQSWPTDRSDAEIIRQNIADQKKLDAKRRETQKQYQHLADMLGIDYAGKGKK